MNKDAAKGFRGLVVVALIIASLPFLFSFEFELTHLISKNTESSLFGKPAEVLHFGGDEENYCTVSFTYEYFQLSVGKLSNFRRNQPEFDMNCNIDGNYYVLSSELDTFSSISLHKSKDLPETALFNIDARLATIDGDSLSVTGKLIPVHYN